MNLSPACRTLATASLLATIASVSLRWAGSRISGRPETMTMTHRFAAAHFGDRRRSRVIRRRDNDRAPFEQISPRVLGTSAMIAGQRMTAHESRTTAPGR